MKLLVLCAALAVASASVVKDDIFGVTITKDTLGKKIYFFHNRITLITLMKL